MSSPPLLSSSEWLSLAPISDSDVSKALKLLRPSKSVGYYDIPCFVINGCSDNYIPIRKHNCNIILSQCLMEASSICSCLK
jgi:hypothetical protein